MYAKDFLNKTISTANKDANTFLNEYAKGTMAGAAIGAGIGLFIGFGRQKNLLMSGFIGAVIGGAITRVFINKK
jgi:uncharacterized protein YqgC (DUF456 family)